MRVRRKEVDMRIALTGHRPERLGFNKDEEHHDWENIR